MKCVKYPKIEQFRHIVNSIKKMTTFIGVDNNNNPIYDNNIKLPIVNAIGTVKLHGTNAGISYNSINNIYVQSRTNIYKLDENNLHFGFTDFVNKNVSIFKTFFDTISKENDIDINVYTITIYGEWCGKSIQKNVGISKIEKAFFIFGIKISNINDENFKSYWLDCSKYKNNECRIYNIYDFKTYNIKIDFNNPKNSQKMLETITNDVENECPVSKSFGINGIGEGVVWCFKYENTFFQFKTKGKKHSVTKTKEIASVESEIFNTIKDFVEYSVTDNRFNQAIKEIFIDESYLDIKKLGDLLKWIVNDILIEEKDVLKENNLEPKNVKKFISEKAKNMFFQRYNTY